MANRPAFLKIASVIATTSLLGLVMVAGPALAVTNPTVGAIVPATAPNDLDTPVTITGADFATDLSGTVPPTVSLGTTALTNVAFTDSGTLTATVPWGMDPGLYTLTVTNPDGGTGGLASAFTVTRGIGEWNGGDVFGGQVRWILMKPGDPTTLYAPAYGLTGLFRSQDAGEHWSLVGSDLFLGNGRLRVDPLHPNWLWAYSVEGIEVSKDQGDTWSVVMYGYFPNGRTIYSGDVYPSPTDATKLFASSEDMPAYADSAAGLIESTNGGTSWRIVPELKGMSVISVAFDPTDPLRMALLTRDARVFRSADAGTTWSEVAKAPMGSIGMWGTITYNPYVSGEAWIVSGSPNGLFKSTDADLSGWQDLMSPDSWGPVGNVTFTDADSAYVGGRHSADGGLTWPSFGPPTFTGALVFDPDDPQVAYSGDWTYGVQKTTDAGLTWQIKNQGLTGMQCYSLEVSRTDPQLVYATFVAWNGIYRSTDGTGSWTYIPIPGAMNVVWVYEDPFDAQRLYVAAHNGFFVSTNGGADWTDEGWNMPPSSPTSWFQVMKPDPFQPGHLLVGMTTDLGDTLGPAYVYSSSDHGASWQTVSMPQELSKITDIEFHPSTPGLVYLTTEGTGVYRSTDSGATWERIDDQLSMKLAAGISIATHPRPMLLVGAMLPGAAKPVSFRSLDGGTTWQKTTGGSEVYSMMFAGQDSTRLYAGTTWGLYLSSDGGDSFTRAAGTLGRLQIVALGYGSSSDHSIIYAATNGGQTGTASRPAVGTRSAHPGITPRVVHAGVYRYLVVTSKVTLTLDGLTGGSLKLGDSVTAEGVVTPGVLVGGNVKIQVQRWDHGWVTVKSVTREVGEGGNYGWKFKPADRGSYRVRVMITKTATHTAAATKWNGFKVK